MIMAMPKGNPLAKSVRLSGFSSEDETFIAYRRRLGPGLRAWGLTQTGLHPANRCGVPLTARWRGNKIREAIGN
jgi:hypothetical protein